MLPPTSELKPEPEVHGHGAGEDTKLLSTNQLIALYAEFRSTQTDILSETGGFAKLLGRRDERLIESFANLVESHVKAAVAQLEPRFGAQDSKLLAVSKEIASLTGRISAIEKAQGAAAFNDELRDIKSSVLSLIDAMSAMVTNKTELAGRKVLLVDDHELILKSLTRVISSYGAHVITASTLATVKALLVDIDPDCVLVDVRLAAGESGADVVRWLLESGVDKSRVLFMSGDTGPVPNAVAAQLGVRLVEKPMASAELVSVIREASSRKN
jgi:CheY-like chemotaxis protein